jgi:hypothetical protein
MKLINRKILSESAAEEWKSQYCKKGPWMHVHTGSPEVIYGKLKALGSSPDPDMVDHVIGNGSWTRVPDCDECGGADVGQVVRIGEDMSYESNTAHVCVNCIKSALNIIEEQ